MTTLSRRELFDRIWSTPMTTNAIELGASASALANLAKRLGLPMPRAGHWMKKEVGRSEEHTSELQSLMRISYAVFCLKKKKELNALHNTSYPTLVNHKPHQFNIAP